MLPVGTGTCSVDLTSCEDAADCAATQTCEPSDTCSLDGQPCVIDQDCAQQACNTPTGLRKIDRTTVLELDELTSEFRSIQARVDQADAGLNPLGLAKGVVPFDIDPVPWLPQGKTHFDQIYDRCARRAITQSPCRYSTTRTC